MQWANRFLRGKTFKKQEVSALLRVRRSRETENVRINENSETRYAAGRRQNWPRQGNVIFLIENWEAHNAMEENKIYRVYNSKNIINVSESLLVHEIQVSTFRSGKVVRLTPVISDVIVAKCQHKTTKTKRHSIYLWLKVDYFHPNLDSWQCNHFVLYTLKSINLQLYHLNVASIFRICKTST